MKALLILSLIIECFALDSFNIRHHDDSTFKEKQQTYKITTTWDSIPVLHDPVTITFKPHPDGLLLIVNAPFFDDPHAPPGEPGKPFNGLWDYEVVESFFLNSQTTQYLEVELCPFHSHYKSFYDIILRYQQRWTMSAVWKYFKVSYKDPKFAICTLCSTEVSRGGTVPKNFSTTGLIHHLKTRHPVQHSDYKKTAPLSKSASGLTPSVATVFEKVKKYASDSPKAHAITANMVVEASSEGVSRCRTEESEKRSHTSEEEHTPSISDMFEEILPKCTPIHSGATTSAATQQLDIYLAEQLIVRSDNPLEYWHINKQRFPLLAQIARRYLSAPSTSTESKRLFSLASHILDEKRNHLSCEKAEQLLFLKQNLPLLLK